MRTIQPRLFHFVGCATNAGRTTRRILGSPIRACLPFCSGGVCARRIGFDSQGGDKRSLNFELELNEKGMASLVTADAVATPVWSFAKAGVELWSPSVGWNPQFTDRDRAFCAALWAHGKRRGLSNDEAEALALMRTWAQRCGGHLRYTPAQERRMATVYTPVAVAVAVATPTEAS